MVFERNTRTRKHFPQTYSYIHTVTLNALITEDKIIRNSLLRFEVTYLHLKFWSTEKIRGKPLNPVHGSETENCDISYDSKFFIISSQHA